MAMESIGNVTFQKGGLHESLGVPQGQKIPAGKMAAAKSGRYGKKAKRQADFAAGFLAKGRASALADAAARK